jgi:hypothetical protein
MIDTYSMLEARFAEEQREHPVPLTAADFPVSYEAITPQWLTQVLCATYSGAAVTACRLGPRDEGTSSRRRISLEYNDAGRRAGLPASVFCKSTHSLKSRFQLALNGFVEGEVRFYNHLRPLLDIEAPKGLFANFNDYTFNSIIILCDMTGTARFCRHDEPMSRERAESQVRLLATLHATFHAKPLAVTFPFLRTWDDTFTATAENGFHEACLRGFQMAEAVIPPRLFAREAEIWPATVESVARHQRLPQTVIHSDPHLKNWYIAASGAMGLNDWQCVCRGHWGRDLAYCLSTALETEDRRAWERDLIGLYLDGLRAKGVPLTSFDDAWTHYRQQLFGALAWWTGTLGQPPNAPEMQPRDSSLQFIGRMARAVDDLEALDAFRA